MTSDYPLSKEEFDSIYSRVPRLTVELIIRNDHGGVYMTKRAIEPCAGQWHLPGGTVFFGETLTEAVKRIAKRELNIDVTGMRQNGYIEYPSHHQNGLDSPVGIVFEVHGYDGEFRPNDEASEGDWFTSLPEPSHADQDTYLTRNHYLAAQ